MTKLQEALLKINLSAVVSPLIGRVIDEENIHTDEQGWYYYIPAKSLKKRHPLIMNHYRGPLFMVIPMDDWNELMEDKISVTDYVDESRWNFGYYWGGGSMLYGAYWMPIEEKGIHDTEKISRYLRILSCRTHNRASGYMPDEERCKNCSVEHCPFSPFAEKNAGASWDNELPEHDLRKDLFELIKNRIKKEFGFEAFDMLPHGEEDGIIMFPNFQKDHVQIYAPQSILVDMLYKEFREDLSQELVDSWNVLVGIPWHMEKDQFVGASYELLPEGAGKSDAYKIWQAKCPRTAREWELTVPKQTDSRKTRISLFDRLFHRKVDA